MNDELFTNKLVCIHSLFFPFFYTSLVIYPFLLLLACFFGNQSLTPFSSSLLCIVYSVFLSAFLFSPTILRNRFPEHLVKIMFVNGAYCTKNFGCIFLKSVLPFVFYPLDSLSHYCYSSVLRFVIYPDSLSLYWLFSTSFSCTSFLSFIAWFQIHLFLCFSLLFLASMLPPVI